LSQQFYRKKFALSIIIRYTNVLTHKQSLALQKEAMNKGCEKIFLDKVTNLAAARPAI